jgi:hypothetical protein
MIRPPYRQGVNVASSRSPVKDITTSWPSSRLGALSAVLKGAWEYKRSGRIIEMSSGRPPTNMLLLETLSSLSVSAS